MKIAIIGAGPRGMLALERLISWQKNQPIDEKLEINIYDPYSIGGRVWAVEQPHELIMNTAAQDITLFPDQSVVMSGPINMGPNLAQWCIDYATDYLTSKKYPEVFLKEVAQITANSYASRALFGIYMHWFYDEQLKRTDNNIIINLIKEEVINVTKNDNIFNLNLVNDHTVSDIVIASLGNLFNEPTSMELDLTDFAKANNLTYVRPNFANEVELDGITENNTVIVRGLGLNFFDLMVRLTYGVGGKFEPKENGELSYISSGKEPKIIAGSLHGLPNHSKGKKQKAPGEVYTPNFLNLATLRRYKKGTLSYTEFWTMLKNEMNYVYYSKLIDQKYSEQINKEYFQLNFLQNPGLAIKNLKIANNDFTDWDEFIYPNEAKKADNFDSYIERFVETDFKEAAKGTKTGPLTSALEVLRDIRANIRFVIDNELLSKNDFVDNFLGQFLSINNLLSMGPPASRLKELHALLKSGIVKIFPGEMTVKTTNGKFIASSKSPNSVEYIGDALIEARIPKVSLSTTNSSLLNNLLKNNYVKNWKFKKENGEEFISGAVDFDSKTNQLIDSNDQIVSNFYFWGVPTEGKKWLTTASPRPYINDPSLRTMDNIVSNIWKNNAK